MLMIFFFHLNSRIGTAWFSPNPPPALSANHDVLRNKQLINVLESLAIIKTHLKSRCILFMSSVSLEKLLFVKPPFPHLCSGENSTGLTGLLSVGLN